MAFTDMHEISDMFSDFSGGGRYADALLHRLGERLGYREHQKLADPALWLQRERERYQRYKSKPENREYVRTYHRNRYARAKSDPLEWSRYVEDAKVRRQRRLASESPEDREARKAAHREACRLSRRRKKAGATRPYSRG